MNTYNHIHDGNSSRYSPGKEQTRQEEGLLYARFLADTRWQQKRLEILRRDGHRCKACGAEGSLEVHHRQYHFDLAANRHVPPWQYDNRHLVTLCGTCHRLGHELYDIPIKYLNKTNLK